MPELSVGATLAWQIAAGEAAYAKHHYIEREHLLIGLCSLEKALVPGVLEQELDGRVAQALRTESDLVAQIFRTCGAEVRYARRGMRQRLGQGTYEHTEQVIHRSEACKAVFRRAEQVAQASGGRDATSLHLLAAILEDPGKDITAVLNGLGAEPTALRDRVAEHLKQAAVAQPAGDHPAAPPKAALETGTPTLDRYGRDLTQEAKAGRLSPVIGRRDELLQVIRTLSRRTKNNPVLIGEAGVGKTAIVEGLAQRIAAGKSLPGKRIIELSLANLVAGTKYRGEFEERLTRVIEEARTHPDVMLFLDEIHTVAGAGRAEGSLDAANILKPALTRGDLCCIGATTIAEYRRYIEKDAALERRFQPVTVNEPSPEETREILQGLKVKYEAHHRVEIEPEALDAIVELTVRYVPDRQLPDKAVDALDEACARIKVPLLSMPAMGDGDVRSAGGVVSRETVAEVIEEWTGLPIRELTGQEAGRLLRLEEFLRQRVVGQDEAIARVAARMRRARVGLGDPRRSAGVFLFLGPTGVGKTELAKALAEALFGSPEQMIRIDMSEYQEKHTVSKLLGAPPGYVGYEEEGLLTGRLRTKPYSVVLLDEIEKAHPEIFDAFLPLFDEGRITDAKGRTIVAKHAIFIMTSNLPPELRLGFEPHATLAQVEETLREVRRHFRPEFINRIDEQLVFCHLSEAHVTAIARRRLEALQERLLTSHQIILEMSEDAVTLLARLGYDARSGARELNRVIARRLEEPLSEQILSGKLRERDHVIVQAAGERLEFMYPSGTQ